MNVNLSRARASLNDLRAGLHQAATLALRAAVEAAEKSAKGTTLWKDRTGGTRASIKATVLGDRGFVVAGGASHFLEYGTKAHIIMGRPILRFVSYGTTYFRRMVHHPGTKALYFMEEAKRLGQQTADYGAEYFVSYAIQKANR